MAVRREPGSQADAAGFDRRQFVRRAALAGGVAWAVPVVTSIGLARASASPCPAGVASSPTAPTSSTATYDTHSPCYRGCSENRSLGEAIASDQFDTSARNAGTDEAALEACAGTFRDDIIRRTTEFQACAASCF